LLADMERRSGVGRTDLQTYVKMQNQQILFVGMRQQHSEPGKQAARRSPPSVRHSL
jgi:hypothetical protein